MDFVRLGDAITVFLLSEAGAGICVARLVKPTCVREFVVSDRLVGGCALKRCCEILEVLSVWMDDERGRRELAVEWLPMEEVEVDVLG